MNNRRNLLVAFGTVTVAPRTLFAQGQKPAVVIGWLAIGAPDGDARSLIVFKDALAALGRKDGTDLVIDAHWASGRSELRVLAEALAAKEPDVIVTDPRLATDFAARAAPGVPIVQANGGSILEAGLATSLARPGGVVTGLISLNWELSEKHTELLAGVMPKLQRIGYLVDRTLSAVSRGRLVESVNRVATQYGVQANFAEVSKREELDSAFAQLRKSGAQAIVLPPSNWFSLAREHIVSLSLSHGLPVIANRAAFAQAGALITYGHDPQYSYRRAAWYVDQILKGRKPGDLPIERPTRFILVVNLNTAKALGITIPRWITLHADRVIG